MSRTVTVLYGENKLQKTLSLPAATTVKQAKKIGSEEILKHLRLQPGVPSTICIDDECTDFYPDAPNTARMRDLKSQVTIMLWPKAAQGDTYTPSPILDKLSTITAELENLRGSASIKEEQRTQQEKSVPVPSSTLTSDTTAGGDSMVISKLTSLEADNIALRADNVKLQEINKELLERNAALKRQLEEAKRPMLM